MIGTKLWITETTVCDEGVKFGVVHHLGHPKSYDTTIALASLIHVYQYLLLCIQKAQLANHSCIVHYTLSFCSTSRLIIGRCIVELARVASVSTASLYVHNIPPLRANLLHPSSRVVLGIFLLTISEGIVRIKRSYLSL